MSINTKKISPICEGTGINTTIKAVGGFIATIRKIHISLNINLQKTLTSTRPCDGEDVETSRTATFSLSASDTFDICGCNYPIHRVFPATIRNEGEGMVYENNKCFLRSFNETETIGVLFSMDIVFPIVGDNGFICFDKPSPNNLCDRPFHDICIHVRPDSSQSPISNYPMPYNFFTCFTGCMYPQRTFWQNYTWDDDEKIGSASLSVRLQTDK